MSELVPLRRSTIGLVNLFFLFAAMIDSASLSHLRIPPKMLTKISGQSIHPGTESNILANIFDNLNTKDIRECSLKQRKYEFVMFGAEVEKINADRIIQVHMLGRSNSSLDITVSIDSKR